jgi:hypothetical protein
VASAHRWVEPAEGLGGPCRKEAAGLHGWTWRPALRYSRSVRAIQLMAGAAAALSIVSVAAAGTDGSLSGAWWFGDYQPEPKEMVISVPQRCWNGGVDFTLTEMGKRLTGKARWIEATGGVPRPPRDETETLTGTRVGNHVVLTGEHKVVTAASPYPAMPGDKPDPPKETVKYDLRLDSKTGHLVGTRNDQPLWLARFKSHPANCGSPPP